MDNIIIIRASAPDGSVFQRVKDAPENHTKDVIEIHKPGLPVLCIGNRMVVPKEQFIQWVNKHTGGSS